MGGGGYDHAEAGGTTQTVNMNTPNGMVQFAPELVLKVVAPAVAFYKKAFGATEVRLFSNDDGSVHVAELSIGGALFHLHEETSAGRRAPEAVGATTVLIGLFVDDPDKLMTSALAAGGQELSPMQDYFYGYRQGIVADPFGHHWMLQKQI
jgi:PhnB protein